MSKKNHPAQELENAMAEALAAVERAEAQTTTAVAAPGEASADPVPENPPDDSEPDDKKPEANWQEQMMRLGADFENFRKRAARQIEETRRYGIEQLLRDILPVVDNLDRALAHSEKDASPIVEGIRMVAKQFSDVLANYGVRSFSSRGEVFDPERHEAVGKLPASDQPPGTIVEEMLKGFFLHERLLRPAQVVVAANEGRKSEEAGD